MTIKIVSLNKIFSIFAVSTFLLFPAYQSIAEDSHGHHGEHQEEEHEKKGPHRGRLLEDHGFSVEVTIFEKGIPPEFRVYASKNGKELRPEDVQLAITLERLGGVTDNMTFKPEADYLKSTTEVYEPHSFDVSVKASFEGKTHEWEFESYEGRTDISEAAQKASGIKIEKVGAASIPSELNLSGKVYASEHKIAHIIPRFPGVVKEGRKHIGDKVEKSEVLALVESNQSLQPYELKSQISGTVVAGHLIVGEFVSDSQWVYIVTDLSEVWVDFFAAEKDAAKVALGSPVEIMTSVGTTIQGEVIYITPFADEKTQTQVVRANVPNTNNLLKPGTFTSGTVTFAEKKVPLAVKTSAIQTFRDWNVVFIKDKSTLFEGRPLELGASGGEWTEVISGLKAGDEYVTDESYLVKADILKSGASHDH